MCYFHLRVTRTVAIGEDATAAKHNVRVQAWVRCQAWVSVQVWVRVQAWFRFQAWVIVQA